MTTDSRYTGGGGAARQLLTADMQGEGEGLQDKVSGRCRLDGSGKTPGCQPK